MIPSDFTLNLNSWEPTGMFVDPNGNGLADIVVKSGSGNLKTSLFWEGCADSAI